MGKTGRVQLKRIENKIDRQGELFEYPTDAWYRLAWTSSLNDMKDNVVLRKSLLQLIKNYWHMMTEDLESFSVKELQNLEHQLDTSLKNIKSRKNQLLSESISDLQRKEKALQEHNTILGEKIKEKEQELGTLGQQQSTKLKLKIHAPRLRTHRPSFSRMNFLMSLL